MHQLQVIVNAIGSPTREQLEFVTNANARRAIEGFGHRKVLAFF